MKNKNASIPIFITGINGSLAYDLINFLYNSHRVYKLARSSNKEYAVVDNINYASNAFLIHLGSSTPYNKQNNVEYRENIRALENAIDIASKYSARLHIIFMSAISVYDINKCFGEVTEDTPIKTNHKEVAEDYAISKIQCEQCLKELHREGKVYSYMILRLPAILSSKAEEKSTNFIVSLIKKLRDGAEVELYGKYNSYNNAIESSALGYFIEKLMQRGSLNNDVVNLAADDPVELWKVINHIMMRVGRTSKITWRSTKDKGFIINIEKAKRLGFVPGTIFEYIDKYMDAVLK